MFKKRILCSFFKFIEKNNKGNVIFSFWQFLMRKKIDLNKKIIV